MRTINPNDLKKDLNNYNLALLFNRHRAREIRRQAAERIHQFANQELWLEEKNCELMYSYIKAFSYMAHRKVTKDALKSFDRLSRIATYNHPKLFWRLGVAPYNISSFWARSVSRLLGRYDRITYKAPDNDKDIAEQKNINQKQVITKEPKRQKETAPKISGKERRQKIKSLRKEQLKQQKQKLIARQKAEKERARQKKGAVLPIIVTAKQPIPTPKPQKLSIFQRNKNRLISGVLSTAAILGGILGVGVLYKAEKQERAKDAKFQAQHLQTENTVQTRQTDSVSRITFPSPSPVYKNYYDSALKIHLGETRRDKLYDNLRNIIITQRLSIPEGESIEHLAHVITVSNLVQPNSATNHFLQECLQSKDALSGAAQNKLWHIVANAGDKAQNIKGTSSHSNFAKQSAQVQQQHLQALQNLRQASR